MIRRRIAIVGGGLAGIAAAVRVAEAGHEPIVIETRRKLGGRATSFVDPRTDEVLDNCQHVLMGCCTNLIDLYGRLGVLDDIEWHERFYWTAGGGDICTMTASRLPAPLHLARSLGKLTFLGREASKQISRAMRAMLRLGLRRRHEWNGRTFHEFLVAHGQGEEAIDRFWNVVIVSACNLDVHRVGAIYALQVFQEGFLAHRWAYTMGLATVPLWSLYDAAPSLIAEQGGELQLGRSAKAIAYDGTRVTGVVTDEGRVDASAVIAAVPFDRLDKLTSDAMRTADARLQRLDAFEVSPILGVHLRFDQPVMELPHLVLVGFDTHWLFNKGTDADGRQHLHAVISAADAWMDRDENEIVSRIVSDVHRALPGSIGLEPVTARAVKERRATFAPTAEIEHVRPQAAPGTVGLGGGGIRNLFLAGDWCHTGWPATMEGAVRSGYAAAEAAVGARGIEPDLPVATFARLMGLR